MRKLISGMKMSADGKIEGPEGYADWVDGWSDDYGMMSQIDACLLGSTMYRGYENYWTAIQKQQPNEPLPMTGKPPMPAEIEWARFAAQTPHYVLSKSMTSALWPNTRFIREIADVAALKQQSGKDIYLMGGAHVTASLIGAGLVDELRFIVYPLIAGAGKGLFATIQRRCALELRNVRQLQAGCVGLTYAIV